MPDEQIRIKVDVEGNAEDAARDIERDLDRVPETAARVGEEAGRKLADGLDDASKRAAGNIGDDLGTVTETAKRVGDEAGKKLADGLDDHSKAAASGIGDDLGTIPEAAEAAGEEAGESFGMSLKAKAAIGIAALVALAKQAADEIKEMVDSATEVGSDAFLMAEQMGIDPTVATVFDQILGSRGEGLDAVRDAVTTVTDKAQEHVMGLADYGDDLRLMGIDPEEWMAMAENNDFQGQIGYLQRNLDTGSQVTQAAMDRVVGGDKNPLTLVSQMGRAGIDPWSIAGWLESRGWELGWEDLFALQWRGVDQAVRGTKQTSLGLDWIDNPAAGPGGLLGWAGRELGAGEFLGMDWDVSQVPGLGPWAESKGYLQSEQFMPGARLAGSDKDWAAASVNPETMTAHLAERQAEEMERLANEYARTADAMRERRERMQRRDDEVDASLGAWVMATREATQAVKLMAAGAAQAAAVANSVSAPEWLVADAQIQGAASAAVPRIQAPPTQSTPGKLEDLYEGFDLGFLPEHLL